ncbi:MAG: four-carbon acid sugar kinase family protein [Actinobacteria bacterium]|nr:four-carbon acid sugar kinase family protein [Actinomycetota bacterium]
MTAHPPVGFIADDITGATDLASAVAGRGFDTRLFFGDTAVHADGGDALVVALKIRSVPAEEARRAAAAAAEALQGAGAVQLFSKYCSTFDSTPEGNIGPIADALIDLTGARLAVHCPAYPANGRTVYLGHLFVGDQLLGESSMREHPLNPMRDSLLTRVLAAQTAREVALVPLPVIDDGVAAVSERLVEIAADGARHAIADAVRDGDLETVAQAVAAEPLAAGGAAFGAAFAAAARGGANEGVPGSARAKVPAGPAAILVGSLSRATRAQVATFDGPVLRLAVEEMAAGDAALGRMAAFVGEKLGDEPMLITTDFGESRTRGGVAGAVQDGVARRIERTMGRMGAELERLGVRRLIVAGGETSGAVADALGLKAARIGPDISVGVPWMVAADRPLAVAFKSGNFGSPTFFDDALEAADA